MKNRTNRISLVAVMLVCCVNAPVDARVNIRKSGTYADAYNQVINVRQQAYLDANQPTATTASATENLPVMVDDEKLANNILNNSAENVNIADLESCSMIYPNGIFKWAIPTSGSPMNRDQQCVAVVELRDVNTNAVLATTTLAAGEIMQCNIDMFPESGWMSELETVELPADLPPTLKDVEKVMNEEQKQNAGLKIAAAVIVSGVAGNMLAPKSAGDNKLLGTNKSQLTSTAIGAVSGGGIMAASVYSGKVVGDTIKSTAVNAATGAIIGNMKAGQSSAESALSVVKCKPEGSAQEMDCIPGNIRRVSDADKYTYTQQNENGEIEAPKEVYLINEKRVLWECKPTDAQIKCEEGIREACYQLELDVAGTKPHYTCTQISSSNLINIVLHGSEKKFEDIFNARKDGDTLISGTTRYNKSTDGYDTFVADGYVPSSSNGSNEQDFFLVSSATKATGFAEHAYAVFPRLPKKLFGYKSTDWNNGLNGLVPQYYARNASGSVGAEIIPDADAKEEVVFVPTSLSASDGALVDFSNAARTKDTIAGAAVGGALGGFAGYQGAKQEIQERWVMAQREYVDSLTNFYCATGTRYLSQYNDEFIIPRPKQQETNK